MFNRHHHTWKLIKTTGSVPMPDLLYGLSARGCSIDWLDKLIHGTTSYLFQCESCQDIRTEVLLGKETVV